MEPESVNPTSITQVITTTEKILSMASAPVRGLVLLQRTEERISKHCAKASPLM